jgi:hypothetical protein
MINPMKLLRELFHLVADVRFAISILAVVVVAGVLSFRGF